MTNWRNIPFLRYEIKRPEEGEIPLGFQMMCLALNIALEKTFKGIKYKKFAIFFTTMNEKNEYVFEMMCHEIEFVANFEKFFEGRYSSEIEPIIEDLKEKFSQVIEGFPFGKNMAATIVYDEQAGKITLGEEPLHTGVTTTSWLLFHLASMFKVGIFVDDGGLIIDNYNLRKLMFHNLDTGTLDFSKIKINIDNYDEWDYYYPEYDREVEINKEQFVAKVEANLNEEIFESKEVKIPQNEDMFLETIWEIITDFKQMVETDGYKLLWESNGIPKDEDSCQILFHIYLKKHCKSLRIDLTREPETGRGPIDFRFSSTVNYIAHVEFKKETNSKLVQGLNTQLPTYMTSEGVKLGFYVIFDFGLKDISNLKGDLAYFPHI